MSESNYAPFLNGSQAFDTNTYSGAHRDSKAESSDDQQTEQTASDDEQQAIDERVKTHGKKLIQALRKNRAKVAQFIKAFAGRGTITVVAIWSDDRVPRPISKNAKGDVLSWAKTKAWKYGPEGGIQPNALLNMIVAYNEKGYNIYRLSGEHNGTDKHGNPEKPSEDEVTLLRAYHADIDGENASLDRLNAYPLPVT